MVPRPMKPISIISNSPWSFLGSWSGIERQRRVPSEAITDGCPRLMFTPDPAAITNSVEMPEQEGIVDLACAGLVAAGIVGELNMRDPWQMFCRLSPRLGPREQTIAIVLQSGRSPAAQAGTTLSPAAWNNSAILGSPRNILKGMCALWSRYRARRKVLWWPRHDTGPRHRSAHCAALLARRTPPSRSLAGR